MASAYFQMRRWVIFAWILTILFALLNLLVFGLCAVLMAGAARSYAIEKLSIYSILRLDFAVLWIDLRVEGHRFQCDSTLADSPVRLFPKITLSMPDGIGAWRGIELLRWLGALPVWWKQVLACISPFTLTSGSKLLESLSRVSIGGGIFAPAFCGSDRSGCNRVSAGHSNQEEIMLQVELKKILFHHKGLFTSSDCSGGLCSLLRRQRLRQQIM